ncbi:TPA: type II toxin-antitoxin system RelE/ParE family toxin [Aeromonas salmonicida subsp. pectinolytica]
MPQVIFAPGAIRDLQRIRDFLHQKNPIAAQRAAMTIIQSVQVLGQQPQIGRPIEDMPDAYREWVIEFGDSGYVARYRLDDETIVILAVRHQREAGFI